MLKRKLSQCSPSTTQNDNDSQIVTSLTSPFAKTIQSGMFIFVVGPEQAEFNIHVYAFAKTSVILEKMMTGGEEEHFDRMARLPDVDSKAFVKFAEFCYIGNYSYDMNTNSESMVNAVTGSHSTGGNKKSSEFQKFELNAIGRQIHRLDKSDLFHCTKCLDIASYFYKYATYPYCGGLGCTASPVYTPQAQRTPSLNCTKCRQKIDAEIGSICSECVIEHLGRWPRNIKDFVELTHLANQLTTFLAMLESRPQIRTGLLAMVESKIPTSEDLLVHIKLYFLATRWGVRQLRYLAVARFCYDLSRFNVVNSRVSEVTDLVKYIYDNIASQSTSTTDEILQKIIMRFVALNSTTMSEHDSGIKDLLRKGGQIAVDLFNAMAAL